MIHYDMAILDKPNRNGLSLQIYSKEHEAWLIYYDKTIVDKLNHRDLSLHIFRNHSIMALLYRYNCR